VLDSALIRYSNLYSEIQNICPQITSLDLSRNLFSSLSTVAEICRPLKELRTLRLTGNRFWDISLEGELVDAFVNVEWLALNMCALRWDEVLLSEFGFVNCRLKGSYDGLQELNMLKLDSIDFPTQPLSSISHRRWIR